MIQPMCTSHNLNGVTMLWIVRAVCTSKIAATLCMGVVALLGDHIVERTALPEDMRAVVDNMTHGAIGLLSWHIVTAHLRDLSLSMRVCEVLFCGLIASAVDLDHFAAARSFRIQDTTSFEIFSVVTGSFSVLMVVLLTILVIQLNITIKKLKKQMALQLRVDQHSYNNPTIQPNEELAVRGFSMFRGQDNSRAPIAPQRDDYPRNLNPKPQPPNDRAPYMMGNNDFFGSFSKQPQQGNYAY